MTNVAENIGEYGRFVHFGCTSSDIVDSALSLQIKSAAEVLEKSIVFLEKSLTLLIRSNIKTLCAGRTHGMFAEPTTFGIKISGYLAELQRNKERLKLAIKQACA